MFIPRTQPARLVGGVSGANLALTSTAETATPDRPRRGRSWAVSWSPADVGPAAQRSEEKQQRFSTQKATFA
jgi:hypothetical protein